MRQILVDDNFYKFEFKRGEGDWKLKTGNYSTLSKPMFEVYDYKSQVLLGHYIGYKDDVVYDSKISLLSKTELQELYFRVN